MHPRTPSSTYHPLHSLNETHAFAGNPLAKRSAEAVRRHWKFYDLILFYYFLYIDGDLRDISPKKKLCIPFFSMKGYHHLAPQLCREFLLSGSSSPFSWFSFSPLLYVKISYLFSFVVTFKARATSRH
eukprot:Rmarinus@m.25017